MADWLETTLYVAVGVLAALVGTGFGILSVLVMFSGLVGIFAFGPGHILTFVVGFMMLVAGVALWRLAVAMWDDGWN